MDWKPFRGKGALVGRLTGPARRARDDVGNQNDLDSDSCLRITSAQVSTNGVQINWSGGAQARQYLQKATGLNGTNAWINLQTNQPPTPTTGSYLDVPGTNKASFYRIRVERP